MVVTKLPETDRMEELIRQTGENGFHFVDEAAPPALMRELALEILRRRMVVSWWTNIRFEKSFPQEHEVYTVKDMNWTGIKNGNLIELLAENNFD